MKKTMEQLKKLGEVVFFDKKISDKAGIAADVAMLAKDYKGLGVDKMLKAKRLDKRVRMLMNCIYWKVQQVVSQRIDSGVNVKLAVKDFPPLAMGVYPFSAKDPRPVIVLCKEEL